MIQKDGPELRDWMQLLSVLSKGSCGVSRLAQGLPATCQHLHLKFSCLCGRSPNRVKDAVASGDLGVITARNSRLSQGVGPRAALASAQLSEMSAEQRSSWTEEARLDAILGSCARSMKSWRSGCRCYIAFVGACCYRAAHSVMIVAVLCQLLCVQT